ncbi:M28 family peptidase [Actinomadura madurae]|uniref:M28 family peptidase n=1 Tax=Actinomadura madurae TaxID=1993 RepID=UPI0027E260E2|nr:M28 family peptidase [Actinomadura madurae]
MHVRGEGGEREGGGRVRRSDLQPAGGGGAGERDGVGAVRDPGRRHHAQPGKGDGEGGAEGRPETSREDEDGAREAVVGQRDRGHGARAGRQRGGGGAHLDSVPAGPGINDNGTGAAALLAIAGKFRELGAGNVRNRVRFVWWGAEEEGLRGSAHYVRSLSRADREKIALNLNFDMLGSPNGVRGVYDGDHSSGAGTRAPAGSGAIERMFREYFKRRGLATAEAEFNGRSDYGPFIERGIPAGGIATGAGGRKTSAEAAMFGGRAGAAYDPCYHRKCDRLGNVNLKLLDGNADAIAHVLQHLARTTVAVNGGARLDLGRGSSSAPFSAPLWRGAYLLR